MKNTRKNTTNHEVTTLEAMPSSKNIVISGTKAMRGIELKATMNGLNTSASMRLRDSARPTTKPLPTPTARPSSVACSVSHRCGQTDCGPGCIHCHRRCATREGWLMKKGSKIVFCTNQGTRVRPSQAPRMSARMSSCHAVTRRRRRTPSRSASGSGESEDIGGLRRRCGTAGPGRPTGCAYAR
ncbi:Uncharacterised protein [Bordetella pertussis]|nr:Uncharacterised protein [Bordetella pertussis]CFV97335.1 Uncharacterised protein [Bordetella pertussis]